MKYIKAIDVWAYGQAIRDGQIRLQSGQWVRLGENGPLSRFHEVSRPGGIIYAFHGPRASQKYLDYVWAIKAARRIAAERREAKRSAAMEEAGQLRLVG